MSPSPRTRSANQTVATFPAALLLLAAASACAAPSIPRNADFEKIVRSDDLLGIDVHGSFASVLTRLETARAAGIVSSVTREPNAICVDVPAPDVITVCLYDNGLGQVALMETVLQHSAIHGDWRQHAKQLDLEPAGVFGDYTGRRRLAETTLAPDERNGSGVVVYRTDQSDHFLLVETSHDQLYGTLKVFGDSDWGGLRSFRSWESVRAEIQAALQRADAPTAARLLTHYVRVDDPAVPRLKQAVAQLANNALSRTKAEAQETWVQLLHRLDQQPLHEALLSITEVERLRAKLVNARGQPLALTDSWAKTAWQRIIQNAASSAKPTTAALAGVLANQRTQWHNRMDQLARVAAACSEIDDQSSFAGRARAFEALDPTLDRGVTAPIWRSVRTAARQAIAQALTDQASTLATSEQFFAIAAHHATSRAIESDALEYGEAAEVLEGISSLDQAVGSIMGQLRIVAQLLRDPARSPAGARTVVAAASSLREPLMAAHSQASNAGLAASAAGYALWAAFLERADAPPLRTVVYSGVEASHSPSASDQTPFRAALDRDLALLASLAADVLPALDSGAPLSADASESLFAVVTDWPLVRTFGLRTTDTAELLQVRRANNPAAPADTLTGDPEQSLAWVAGPLSATHRALHQTRTAGQELPPELHAQRSDLLRDKAWLDVHRTRLADGNSELDLDAVESRVAAAGLDGSALPFNNVDSVDLPSGTRNDPALRRRKREFDRRRSAYHSRARSFNQQLAKLRSANQRTWFATFEQALLRTRDQRLDQRIAQLRQTGVPPKLVDHEAQWLDSIFGRESAEETALPPVRRTRSELQVLRGALTARIRTSQNPVTCAHHLRRDLAAAAEHRDVITVEIRTYIEAFGHDNFAIHVAQHSHDPDQLLLGIARNDRQRILRLLPREN